MAGKEHQSDRPESGFIRFPPFQLDLRDQRLWRGDRLIPLKPRAFSILKCLLETPGRLRTREELLALCWGGTHFSEGVLKTQIAELRLALEDSGKTPRFIETAHRRGYRFIGSVEPAAPASEPRSSAIGEVASLQ